MPSVVGFRATIIPIKLLHSYGFNQPNHGCYGLGRTVPTIAAPVAHRTIHDGLVLGNLWNPKWKPFCCNCIFCVNNLVFNLRIVLILVASSHVESTSSNSRWLSSPHEYWGRNAQQWGKAKRRIPNIPADRRRSCYCTWSHHISSTLKPHKSTMILQFPLFFAILSDEF